MKIKIEKINSETEEQKNIIQQIEEIIGKKEESLKSKILAVVDQNNWREEILNKPTWKEAQNYGNQILALILIQEELIVAEKALVNNEEWEKISESISRLEEVISVDDNELKTTLSLIFEGNSYEKKINELLGKLTELAKETDQWEENEEEGNYGLINEEKLEVFLKEIEKLCEEKGVVEEQINNKLTIKLRSGELSNYRQLIKRKVYSQRKLDKWRTQLVNIIQQIELEKRLKEIAKSKPFDLVEFQRIKGELVVLDYHNVYSKVWGIVEETPMKKTQEEEKDEKIKDFNDVFKVKSGGVERTIIRNKKEVKETSDNKLAQFWFEARKETKLTAEKSKEAWLNGWNPPKLEKNLSRKDLPYNKPRGELGIWIKKFEEVEKKTRKKIETEEIVKWWENRGTTDLNAEKSAGAWGNGWNYEEIKDGLGTIVPQGERNEKSIYNIPVEQKKTLVHEKEEAKMKLIKFFRAFDINKEEELDDLKGWKKGINEAEEAKVIQELLKNYFKKIAYDQINYSLTSSSLEKSVLSKESQSNIIELANESADSKVKDAKHAEQIRSSILGEIEATKIALEFKELTRNIFIEEIKNRLELAKEDNWVISLEKIDDKEWDDYISKLDTRIDGGEVFQKVSDDLLIKLKEEIKKADNESKLWEPGFTDEDWEALKNSFTYNKTASGEGVNPRDIKTINIESVVAAVKKMAISRWEKKVEEKIELAKEMISREERDGDEAKKLIEELDSIAQWETEKDGSNKKEALKSEGGELNRNLELLRYNFYLSEIKKIKDIDKIDEIGGEIGKKIRISHLPPGKKIGDLDQALFNQKARIVLEEVVNNSVIPDKVREIDEELNKLRSRVTEEEKNAYNELNENGAVDKKELELMKTKHLQVNGVNSKWGYDLPEEYRDLIKNSENKDKLSANLRKIEVHFQFRSDFYQAAEIDRSSEKNQLIDKYRELSKRLRWGGKQAGLVYKNGWEDPDAINEEGFANLDGEKYIYDVRRESKLQAEIMQELQNKIDEAESKIDNSTLEERAVLSKEFLSFNEEWVEKGENELAKEARRGSLEQKKTRLDQVLRKLAQKEIQSIHDDMLDKDKYDRDYDKLEELVGDRIRALDDKYKDGEGRSKDLLEKLKEATKDYLRFRADFLAVAGKHKEITTIVDGENEEWEATGEKEEEFSDEFIYGYQDKGFDGRQAGQVYLNGWTDPGLISSRGYASLKSSKEKSYSFLVLGVTRKEAGEKLKQEEKLLNLIHQSEEKDNLEKLESHLKKLEKFISPTEPVDGQPSTSVRKDAYLNNQEMADSKRQSLVEAIDDFKRKLLVKEVDVAVEKINVSLEGLGVGMIEDDGPSTSLSNWRKLIENKKVSLEEIKKRIEKDLTDEIGAILAEKLEKIISESKVDYEKLGIGTTLRKYFLDKNLTGLATEGSEMVRKIINQERNDDVQNAIDTLQKLINEEKSEDLEKLYLNLNRLQDLIPVKAEGISSTGRSLTPAELEAYRRNREAAEKKELDLLKEVFKKEDPFLNEKELEEIDKAVNRDQFLMVKKQLAQERSIGKVLKDSEEALKGQNSSQEQLLELISVLQRFNGNNSEWERKAFRSKSNEIKSTIRSLRVKAAGIEFDEYIEIINGENDLLKLNKLGEEWNTYLLLRKVSDSNMPEGKKVKDLLAAVDKRRKEIGKENAPREKSKAEELSEIKGERDSFKEQLESRNIILEGNDWTDEVLEVIDKEKNLERKLNQAEEILGLPLESLERNTPPLTNLSEIANLLTEVGILSETDGNYDPEILKNKLTELVRKGEENDSLHEAIKNKGDEIEKLNNDLGISKGKEVGLMNSLSSIGEQMENVGKNAGEMKQELEKKEKELKVEKERAENAEKRIQKLTEQLGNSEKQVSDLREEIAGKVGKEEEERRKELKEIAQDLGIGEQEIGDKSAEEIKVLIREKVGENLKNLNKIREELPDLMNEKGEVDDSKLGELKELANKVQRAESFGLTEWNNLDNQTQGETLTSLLGRPKKSELEEAGKALAKERLEHNRTKVVLTDEQNENEKARADLAQARKDYADEKNRHDEDKNKLAAANAIINDAKKVLGIENLGEALTNELKDKTLPQIIKELNEANLGKGAAEELRDRYGEELEKEKKEHDATKVNLDAEKNGHQATKDQLATIEAERDSRPDITQEDYQRLLNNQRPENLPKNWQEQLGRIPDLENNQRPINLPNDWEEKINRIGELEKRPTQDKYNEVVKERDRRPNVSQEEYEEILAERDRRPNISQQDWEDDYKKRPIQQKLEEEIKNATDKYNGYVDPKTYRVGWINPKNITNEDQNTLEKIGYVPAANYQGWINPNDEKARQENGLRTVAEVDKKLDGIAGKLGLGDRNGLTDDNLANFRGAEQERNHARNSLRTNDLNNLPQIPKNETLQTLLERPTKEEQEEAVNNARQQEADKYNGYINPTDREKLGEAAKKVGLGFAQQDIENAINKERENWKGYVDPETYRTDWIDPKNLESEAKKIGLEYRKEDLEKAVKDAKIGLVDPNTYRKDWIDPNQLEAEAIKRGMHSAAEYNKLLANQRPENLPSDWEQQIADKDRYLQERNARPEITHELEMITKIDQL